MATATDTGVTVPRTDIILDEADARAVEHIFGGARFTPDTMSPEMKAVVLSRFATIALAQNDRAFKPLHLLVRAPNSSATKAERVYSAEESGELRFAPLIEYLPLPTSNPILAGDVSNCVAGEGGASNHERSDHLLLQQPMEDGRKAFFWRMTMCWELKLPKPEENQKMHWRGYGRVMRPVFLSALPEALAGRIPCESFTEGIDPFAMALGSLVKLSERTRLQQERDFQIAQRRHSRLLEAVAEMGI